MAQPGRNRSMSQDDGRQTMDDGLQTTQSAPGAASVGRHRIEHTTRNTRHGCRLPFFSIVMATLAKVHEEILFVTFARAAE
jgi:hypothetical protein